MTIDEKACVSLFDEVTLKRAALADHWTVFYLCGRFSNWKISFCFYVSA